ncbi:MAG: hypothetical protein KDD62_02480, partial [Bdellovibrionales bacterium]|nr:hypothetical protein [Bdellovibrionales bacterium]
MEDPNHKLLIELERVTSERSTLKAENKKLRKENEELRSALEAYESHKKHHQNAPHCELERSKERL